MLLTEAYCRRAHGRRGAQRDPRIPTRVGTISNGIDDVFPLNHNLPAVLARVTVELHRGIEGNGPLDELKEPDVGLRIPHPDRTLERKALLFDRAPEDGALVHDEIFVENPAGEADVLIHLVDHGVDLVESERTRKGRYSLVRRMRYGEEEVGAVEPSHEIARETVDPHLVERDHAVGHAPDIGPPHALDMLDIGLNDAPEKFIIGKSALDRALAALPLPPGVSVFGARGLREQTCGDERLNHLDEQG